MHFFSIKLSDPVLFYAQFNHMIYEGQIIFQKKVSNI